MLRFCVIWVFILTGISVQAQISVGSKNFPESRLLAEIMAQTIEQNTDLKVERRFGLGGTLICYEALFTGSIDVYPEYTGTVLSGIFQIPYDRSGKKEVWDLVSNTLNEQSIKTGPAFGFSNSYVITCRDELDIRKISDLANHPELRYGFSNEFLNREDGYKGMSAFYGLPRADELKGLEHGLAYQALANDQIDVTDAYSTDGKLAKFNFRALEDDKRFFPPYEAFPMLYGLSAQKYPELIGALKLLENNISTVEIQQLNYRYEVKSVSLEKVAFDFLQSKNLASEYTSEARLHPILIQLLEHIHLTLLATFLAILLAVPLGIYLVSKPKLAKVILSIAGAIQTIPSLALLGIMIPLFGIGFLPAVIALFLYALLPIIRNTYTGMCQTDPILIEAATALGMTENQQLIQLRLPLATEVIMAGIRTALTINVGTATLAAFIGAGGLGESIITGITLNDHQMILQGAIPATLLALGADALMALVQKRLRPKGLRKPSNQ